MTKLERMELNRVICDVIRTALKTGYCKTALDASNYTNLFILLREKEKWINQVNMSLKLNERVIVIELFKN